jgi:microcystin-dependent protein
LTIKYPRGTVHRSFFNRSSKELKMANSFVGEIRMFGGNFAPQGWAFCDGQLIPISENDILFNLIGTTYGGDGQNTFALPNMQSRVPIHVGPGFALAQSGGAESVTLTTSQIPSHSHVPQAQTASGDLASPGNAVWASVATSQYSDQAPNTTMAPAAIGSSGGSQPHENMMPFLVVNFILSLFGVFPSQN